MRKHRSIVVLIALCLLGFGLRLYHLDTVPLRGDEAFSVQRWTLTPLSESLTQIAAIEPHPPLTYALFRAWGLIFGAQSEFALRMLPLLVNMLGIPAMYALGKYLTKQPIVGLLAAFVWAIHPFQIWHAQDYRNYGIWGGLTVLTLWLALRVLHSKQPRRSDWLIYTGVALFSCMVFYNELITIGTLGLYGIAIHYRNRHLLFRWSLLNSAIIVFTIATYVLLQGNLINSGAYGGTTGGFDAVQLWERFVPVLMFGETLSLSLQQQINPTTEWWVLITGMIIASTIIVATQRNRAALFLLFVSIIPLIVLSIISTQLGIFRPRYIMPVAPAYTLILCYTVMIAWRATWSRPMSISIVAVIMGLSAISLNNYYHNPAYLKAPDWAGLVDYLVENTRSDEVIIQTSVDASFGFYYEINPVPAPEFALPANFDQPISDIISEMQATANNHHSLWIVGQTFPDWQNAGVVEDWAFDNLQRVRESNLAGLPVRQFMNYDVLPTELAPQPLATFDDTIVLAGANILAPTPTNTLTVWLYWQPNAQTDSSLTAFVHLVGAPNPVTGSPLWAQDDHPPQNGRIQSDTWAIDTVHRDVFMLPLTDVASGTYTLYTGWYNPITQERLLLEDGSDAYALGSVVIP